MVGLKIMKDQICCIVMIDRDLRPTCEIHMVDMVLCAIGFCRTTYVSACAFTVSHDGKDIGMFQTLLDVLHASERPAHELTSSSCARAPALRDLHRYEPAG